MDLTQRLDAVLAGMREQALDLLVGIHDGAHFIEKPDPVMTLAGFKSLGPCAVVVTREGQRTLVVSPAWDAERAARHATGWRIVPAQDPIAGLRGVLPRAGAVGIAGLDAAPWRIAEPLGKLLPEACAADAVVFEAARRKTAAEIAHAREATRIAELGFQRLLELARPGVTEDQLATELRWHSRTLGAEDNFLLLCAGPHNRAVAPSHGRPLQMGDLIVVELTPSYRGQLAQICRTISIGPATDILRRKYQLVVDAMNAGIAAARPGARMSDVCSAINAVLEAEGYGEFCHPPHIRRRGHGLGFGTMQPGDVALDNALTLEPGMLFMIHPNQYLPETGYLLCGEPVLMTDTGAEPLTARRAALAEICT